MARKIKAVYSVKKYNNGEVNDFAQNVHDSINGNAAFATPDPSLADLQTSIDDFNTAYLARITSQGGKVNVAAVDTARGALDRMLSNVCAYVNSVANQDPMTEGDVIDSSGFPRNKVNSPVGILPAPENLRAIISKTIPAGSFRAAWEKIQGASGYVVTVTGDGGFSTSFNSTKARVSLDGLTSGGFYQMTVQPFNTEGLGVLSNVLNIRAF